MNAKVLAGGIAALLTLVALPAGAQVSGGVVVHDGPVTAHAEVGAPPPVVVVHEAPVRDVVVVERVHEPHGKAHGWWKKHGYREVTIYYDGSRYYSRRLERRPGLRAIVVYERAGRYYRWDDQDDDHDGRGHGHGHDRD